MTAGCPKCGRMWEAIYGDAYECREHGRFARQDVVRAAVRDVDLLTANGHRSDPWDGLVAGAQRYARTDAGNAELFANLFGDRLRYDHRRGRWLRWREHWWEPDDDGAVMRFAIDAVRTRYHQAGELLDAKERQHEAEFAVMSESRRALDAMLVIAQSLPPLADSGEGWDDDPMLLGVENGIVDLRAGELRPGKPEDRISGHAPVAFDPKATCPLWETFLKRVLPDPELRDYLQRLCGHALTGDASIQKIWLWCGPGANGKSTAARTIMHVLGRDYARMTAPQLLLRKHNEQHPTEIADLAGARLVVSVEVEDGRAFAEALIKQMTGGDRMKGRFMRQDFFEFDMRGDIWLLANHKPVVKGTDWAIWRRVALIPWEVIIPDDEQDPQLIAKLCAESPGILNWAIAGCLEWQRNGLGNPAAVTVATETYRTESDVLAPFIEARCVVGDGYSAAASVLQQAYSDWVKENHLRNRDTLSQKDLSARLIARGFGKTRKRIDGKQAWFYEGVGIIGGVTRDGM